VAIDGFWNVAIKTPVGTRRTVIEFYTAAGVLKGVSRNGKDELTLNELTEADSRLTWWTNVTKPMRMVMSFDVEIDGDTMTGTAKGGPMSSAKVTGTRTQGPPTV
jgi:hypothetical protein